MNRGGEVLERSAHLLVVDDESDIRDELQSYLQLQGYRVSTADGGNAMRRILETEVIDLVVLDLMMPGEDGLTLTRSLRETSSISIIILTGQGDPVEEIVGLELGADDYISKPCDLRQLLARVRSVLRRRRSDNGALPDTKTSVLEFAGWVLDPSRRQLLSPDGADVVLTTAEYEILEVLVAHSEKVLTRDQILDLTRGHEWAPFDRSVDNLVSRLRKKIEPDPKNPTLIKTVHRVGYIFSTKVSAGHY